MFGMVMLIYMFLTGQLNITESREDKEDTELANLQLKISNLESTIKEQKKPEEPKDTTQVVVTPYIDSWSPPFYGWYNGYNSPWYGGRRGGRRRHH